MSFTLYMFGSYEVHGPAPVFGQDEALVKGRGPYITTFTGREFYALDPKPEDIFIEDVAHALANQCRWSGHTRYFYCPTLDQRILTADLQWLPAGDLKPGQKLLGFDETLVDKGAAGKLRRRYRPSEVVTNVPIKRQTMRLELEDGSTVRCSAEHPWLIASKKSRNQKWLTTREIAADLSLGRVRYMHKFFEPWKEETTYDMGWLAGILDGEGHFVTANRTGVQMGVAQNPGLTLDKIKELLSICGISVGYSKTGQYKCETLSIAGGWREILRLLGSVRPIRLLDKFQTALFNGSCAKGLYNLKEPLRITHAYAEGEAWVSGIETTTHTYFCEGYGAHNSVANHAVRVAELANKRYGPLMGLLALHHDDSEAYIVDIPRPFKHMVAMDKYREIETGVQAAAYLKLCGYIGEIPREIKEIDNEMLVVEAKLLMGNPKWAWGLPVPPEYLETVAFNRSLDFQDAEEKFLAVHNQLKLEILKEEVQYDT